MERGKAWHGEEETLSVCLSACLSVCLSGFGFKREPYMHMHLHVQSEREVESQKTYEDDCIPGGKGENVSAGDD